MHNIITDTTSCLIILVRSIYIYGYPFARLDLEYVIIFPILFILSLDVTTCVTKDGARKLYFSFAN